MTDLESLSFESLIALLNVADDSFADPDFDPQTLVGDLRNKVDGLKSIETRMDLVADYFERFAKPIIEKARTVRKNRERLRDYIAQSMLDHKFQTVPGNLWKVRLREANPKVVAGREPTVADYLEMTDLVRVETVYSWDKNAIKDVHATTAAEDMEGLPFKVVRGHWPEFVANVPEVLEKKKREKKT